MAGLENEVPGTTQESPSILQFETAVRIVGRSPASFNFRLPRPQTSAKHATSTTTQHESDTHEDGGVGVGGGNDGGD